VHPLQELRAVKTPADQHKTQARKELTYDQYANLLLSAASAYDALFAPKTHFAARAPRRAVYSHDFTASNEDNADPGYDIDNALNIIQPTDIRLVHLALAWHLHSGHSCLRMRRIFGTSSKTRQKASSSIVNVILPALLDAVLHVPLFATHATQ
jgi:hypothetical protein